MVRHNDVGLFAHEEPAPDVDPFLDDALDLVGERNQINDHPAGQNTR